jgi:multimeric flavodoxin WrbA
MDRRDFLKKAAMGAAAITLAAAIPASVKAMIENNEKKNDKQMKKIVILNGSPRKNGKTASLVNAFVEGAKSAGHEVRELYLPGMNINGCAACEACSQNGGHCVQQDNMAQVYEAYEWADVVALASPEFWGTVSGQLKIVVDRLYAEINKLGMNGFRRDMVLIMTARGDDYSQALDFYHIFTEIIGCRNLGTILGAGKEEEARQLGASIK